VYLREPDYLVQRQWWKFSVRKGDMVNIFRRVAQILKVSGPLQDVPATTHNVPGRAADDWRAQRLAEAAQKYGKPFKCASDDMPREVIVGGKHLVAVGSRRGATRRLDEMSEFHPSGK
jgi:hypothetical protein